MLGGTQFVGPAIVDGALARGWDVTVANRGLSGSPAPGARHFLVDRTIEGALAELAAASYDAVFDLWSGAPAVMTANARVLRAATQHWSYVSSRSVYAWPLARSLDESGRVDPRPSRG